MYVCLQVNIECETAIDKVECANAALRADLDRWMDVKSKELTGLVVDMADQHIEYHEKVCACICSHVCLCACVVYACVVCACVCGWVGGLTISVLIIQRCVWLSFSNFKN